MENRDKLTNRKSSGNYKKSGKEKLFRCKSSSIYTFVYVFSSRYKQCTTNIRVLSQKDMQVKRCSISFSPDKKFKTWRKLWIALAETEYELGLDSVTKEQIEELKAHADDINFDVAKAREKEVRHDVMSHVYAYGVQCPNAKGIIHLGATSCYVGDNTDIIIMTEALKLVSKQAD